MGLDTYLHKKKIESDREKVIRKLNNEERDLGMEIGYWRKCYFLNDWFLSELGVDNCEEGEVSKELLEEFIEYLNEIEKEEKEVDYYEIKGIKKQINKIIKETDWEKEQIIFYAWE